MDKTIFHISSFVWALVFSYFFFPANLSSPMSILGLLICNFVVVEIFDYLKNQIKNKKN